MTGRNYYIYDVFSDEALAGNPLAIVLDAEDLDDAAMQHYLDEGAWRGKAGAYNLQERIDAGWPIRCEGDPSTVMGLPMRRLRDLFGPAESDTVSP